MSSSERDLEKVTTSASRWETASGFAVVIGLVIEVALALMFPGRASFIEHWGHVAAGALVALGVYGEIRFAGRVSEAQETLRRLANARVASANARASIAEATAARLRAQLAWRRIDSERKAEMLKATAPGSTFRLKIEYSNGDPESNVYAHDIGSVFETQGWTVGYDTGGYDGTPIFGVRAPMCDPPLDAASKMVQAALRAAGIDYTEEPVPEPHFSHSSDSEPMWPYVRIYVGPKAMPPSVSRDPQLASTDS